MLQGGRSHPGGKVQWALPVGFLKQYLSWGMIKGQWSIKRQEEPSRKTWRSMDGWKVASVAAVQRPRKTFVWANTAEAGEGWGQHRSLLSRQESHLLVTYNGNGLKGGDMIWFVCWLQWGDQITIIHSGRWTSQGAAVVIQRKDYGSSDQTSDDEN